jgi:ribosome modulation factor
MSYLVSRPASISINYMRVRKLTLGKLGYVNGIARTIASGLICYFEGIAMTAQHNPFLEGLAAFIEGIPRVSCPYSAAALGRTRWLEGWDFGKDLPTPEAPRASPAPIHAR